MRNRKKSSIYNHIDYHNSFEFSTCNNKSLNGWYTTKVRNIYIYIIYVCMYVFMYILVVIIDHRQKKLNKCSACPCKVAAVVVVAAVEAEVDQLLIFTLTEFF